MNGQGTFRASGYVHAPPVAAVRHLEVHVAQGARHRQGAVAHVSKPVSHLCARLRDAPGLIRSQEIRTPRRRLLCAVVVCEHLERDRGALAPHQHGAAVAGMRQDELLAGGHHDHSS